MPHLRRSVGKQMDPVTKRFDPTCEAEVLRFEGVIGFSLPDDYRGFLLETNGGVAAEAIFPIPSLGEDSMLDVFYGIGLERPFDLEFWWDEYNDDMPERSIIIGADPGNGMIMLSVGDDPGIYFWDHSHFFPESNEKQNAYFLAHTFTGFISTVKPSIT